MNPFLTGKRGFYHSLQERASAREEVMNKVRRLGGLPEREKSDPFPIERVVDVGYHTRDFYQRLWTDYQPVGLVVGRGRTMNDTFYSEALDSALEVHYHKMKTSFEKVYRELEEARKPKTNRDALSLLNKGQFGEAPPETSYPNFFDY